MLRAAQACAARSYKSSQENLTAEGGIPSPQEDVRKLERALEEATGDIDILLTCEWPADVTAATPPGSAPAEASMPGQPPHLTLSAQLLMAPGSRSHLVQETLCPLLILGMWH